MRQRTAMTPACSTRAFLASRPAGRSNPPASLHSGWALAVKTAAARGREYGQRKKFTVARRSRTLAPGQDDEHIAAPFGNYRPEDHMGGISIQLAAGRSMRDRSDFLPPNSCTCLAPRGG